MKTLSKGQATKIVPLEIDSIVQKENARATYNQTEMAELMQSMKHSGLLQPIGVRPLPGGEKFELMYGNRRYLAAKKLGWHLVDCIILDDIIDDEMLIVNSIENMQRVDVSYAEQGRIFSKLLKQGLTAEQIAVRIGVSKNRIMQALDVINRCPPEIQDSVVVGTPGKQVKNGEIPAGAAFKALSIATRFQLSPEQKKSLLKHVSKDGIPKDNLNVLGGLMGNGLSFERALSMCEHVKMVSVLVPMQRKKIKALEKQEGMTVRQVLYHRLIEDSSLGIIRYQDSPRVKVRKKKGGG